MNMRSRVAQIFITGAVFLAAACGHTLLSAQEAHAYTYLNSNTTSVFNRTFITVNTSGYLELIGCDPHDTSWLRPCWENERGGCYGYVANYQWAIWGNTGGQDDLKWYSAWRGSWTRNGYPFGTGRGQTERYGYGWGGTVISRHGGFDELMYAHVYITSGIYPNPTGMHEYGETSFWPRVKIQYNANGGTNAPAAHLKYIGTGANISSAKPTRTGYTFEGWSTKKAGPVNVASGQYVGLEDWNLKNPVYIGHGWGNGPINFWNDTCGGTSSPTGTNTITLYAQWKPITYALAYNGNGATGGATASSTHVYDAAKALTANGFSRTYSLACDSQGGSAGTATLTCRWAWKNWSTTANGGGGVYADRASVKNVRSVPGTTTLYAQWNPGSVVLPDPGTKKDCTFKGWFTAAQGGSLIGQAGTPVSIAANTTYYAQWEEHVAVNYFVDGDHTPAFSELVTSGAAYSVNPQADGQGAKNDCAGLDGWYTDAACTQRYVDGSALPADGLSLYGRNKVMLSYDFADRSRTLFAGHELFSDEALDDSLVLEQLLPQTQTRYYGDRVTFARGRSAWFSAHGRAREAVCEVGAYATTDASGTPLRTMRLTGNTVAYLLWRVPNYDGIALS